MNSGWRYCHSGTNFSMLGSGGVESMKVQDGAVFYETDTNKVLCTIQ